MSLKNTACAAFGLAALYFAFVDDDSEALSYSGLSAAKSAGVSVAGSPPAGAVTPETSGLSPIQGEWMNHLCGMMLKQLESYGQGGGDASAQLHLGSDGTYAAASSGGVAVGGASGSWGDHHQGRWSIVVHGDFLATLILRADDGRSITRRVEFDPRERATYLDGARAYVVPSPILR